MVILAGEERVSWRASSVRWSVFFLFEKIVARFFSLESKMEMSLERWDE